MFSRAITPGKAIARKHADIVIRGMAAGIVSTILTLRFGNNYPNGGTDYGPTKEQRHGSSNIY